MKFFWNIDALGQEVVRKILAVSCFQICFPSVCCLSVCGVTQKVLDEFSWNFFLECRCFGTRSGLQNFGDELFPDVGVFLTLFTSQNRSLPAGACYFWCNHKVAPLSYTKYCIAAGVMPRTVYYPVGWRWRFALSSAVSLCIVELLRCMYAWQVQSLELYMSSWCAQILMSVNRVDGVNKTSFLDSITCH